MKTIEAMATLARWDTKGRYVFTTGDLSRLFGEPRSDARLSGTLTRLVKEQVLERPTRGVYVYALSSHFDATTLPRIALASRRGFACVESFETAAARWGIIEQTYPLALTVATTGRSGELCTSWGHVTLIHTQMTPHDLYRNSVEIPGDPMRLASRKLCLHNLKRSGRVPHLVLEYSSKEASL